MLLPQAYKLEFGEVSLKMPFRGLNLEKKYISEWEKPKARQNESYFITGTKNQTLSLSHCLAPSPPRVPQHPHMLGRVTDYLLCVLTAARLPVPVQPAGRWQRSLAQTRSEKERFLGTNPDRVDSIR